MASATLKDEATQLTAAKFAALNKGGRSPRATRVDGATDGLIEDPGRCAFDPASVQCAGVETDSCLTPAQVGAARKIHSPAVNPRTNARSFRGCREAAN